ncbi:hypothetical protein ACFZBU_47270 [Embleya sp. NPDC008237]|uniref:hypothetical protein n=1 Tax=Embleya sp. NPDC008237 TaxID=3363978 RepID=UPI0036E64EEB
MAIEMPNEEGLPPGPRRDLVAAFHELYTEAGCPGTRNLAKGINRNNRFPTTVSHETLAKLLHGRSVPAWSRLDTAVRYLVSLSFREPDEDATVARFHALWRADLAAPPPAVPAPTAPTIKLDPEAALTAMFPGLTAVIKDLLDEDEDDPFGAEGDIYGALTMLREVWQEEFRNMEQRLETAWDEVAVLCAASRTQDDPPPVSPFPGDPPLWFSVTTNRLAYLRDQPAVQVQIAPGRWHRAVKDQHNVPSHVRLIVDLGDGRLAAMYNLDGLHLDPAANTATQPEH